MRVRGACWAIGLLGLGAPATAAEPDGLVLPPGFHAEVVVTGIKGLRHLAVRPDGDLYASTRGGDAGGGIVAIHLAPDGTAAWSRPFGAVAGGTGLRLHGGWLYASSSTAVYRFRLGSTLVPADPPETVIDGLPATGFSNRVLAFDNAGGLFVGVGGSGNICAEGEKGQPPVGRRPCPDLAARAGVWRFAVDRISQHFPADGVRWVTGLRDLDALDWRRAGGGLYGAVHGRNGTHAGWPALVSSADEEAIGEDLYRFDRGADLGWPYTYYDKARHLRLAAPEYGGTGRDAAPGDYATPVASLPAHAAPLDLLFYRGRAFPPAWRDGAFVALHGGLGPETAEGRAGYSVAFVRLGTQGGPATITTFADGFAGPDAASRTVARAAHRPVGLAEAPDGSLYVADSVQGRVWRIRYTGR